MFRPSHESVIGFEWENHQLSYGYSTEIRQLGLSYIGTARPIFYAHLGHQVLKSQSKTPYVVLIFRNRALLCFVAAYVNARGAAKLDKVSLVTAGRIKPQLSRSRKCMQSSARDPCWLMLSGEIRSNFSASAFQNVYRRTGWDSLSHPSCRCLERLESLPKQVDWLVQTHTCR